MSLDNYINQYYIDHLEEMAQPPKSMFQCLSFSNLTPEQKIVQITISIKISEKLLIKDKIEWNLAEEKKSPKVFSEILINTLSPLIKSPKLVEQNKKAIRNQIYEQLIFHVCKVNQFPKFHVISKQSETGLNDTCANCGTIKYNEYYCVNCQCYFEKVTSNTHQSQNNHKTESSQNQQPNEDQLTERQRILQLRQKNINIEGNYMNILCSEGFDEIIKKEKKTCKKCGEINEKISLSCKNCGYKFPVISCYNVYNGNLSYCIHFWDKLNKNHIIQQLKPFTNFFKKEDFSSLRYLYERTKEILNYYYKNRLTPEAFGELFLYIDQIYKLFSTPSPISQHAFDTTYANKFKKPRVEPNELNCNKLPESIREGWLPENDVNFRRKSTKKLNQKTYDNITKNNINNDEFDEDLIFNCNNQDNSTKRKRGRPKKIDIFRENGKYQQGSEYDSNEPQIILCERETLLKNDIIIEDNLLHYDFCGRCFDLGKLICCETCSSAFHFECLGYDKFPRGKFKCYFCKVVKLGIDQAMCITQEHMDIVHKLVEVDTKYDKWFIKAQELLDVLKEHQCSCFFKEPIPKSIEAYYDVVKEPRDLSLVETKLKNWEYKTLNDFLSDLKLVWSNIKLFYKPQSFFWRQADILEMFFNHLIKVEKIFERFPSNVEITQEEIDEYTKYKENKLKEIEMKKKERENQEKKVKTKKGKKGKGKHATIEEEKETEESKESNEDTENTHLKKKHKKSTRRKGESNESQDEKEKNTEKEEDDISELSPVKKQKTEEEKETKNKEEKELSTSK